MARINWSPETDATLLRLRGEGVAWKEIGAAMGRLTNSVMARFSLLQHRAAESTARQRQAERIKVRACLCCGKSFKSEGPHNRLCDSCRRG